MTAPLRLALFAALLAAVFGGAAAVGAAVDPDGGTTTSRSRDEGAMAGMHEGDGDAELPGLAGSSGGLRLELATTTAPRPGRVAIAFRLLDDHGMPVRDLDVAHGRKLHLIVVRRDLTHFRHLHPRMSADGTWRAVATLPEAGSYRVFADTTRDGVQRTLGADLQVAGAFAPHAFPAPTDTVRDDHGLTVRRRIEPGGTLAFDVLRGGRVVDDELEDYLGAKGHLVTLRAGDLAYLHTHPEGDRLAFGVHLPGAGSYASWVQFRLRGVVHTAAFTEAVTS